MRLSLIVASLGMLEGLSAGKGRSVPSFCSGESERSEAASSFSLLWSLMLMSSSLAMLKREGECRGVCIYLYGKTGKEEGERKGGAGVGGAKRKKKEREGGLLWAGSELGRLARTWSCDSSPVK